MNQKTISLGLCMTIVFAFSGIVLPQTAGAAQPEPSKMETKTSDGPAPLDASEMESYSQLEKQAAEDGALDQAGAETSAGTAILAGVGVFFLVLIVLAAAAA